MDRLDAIFRTSLYVTERIDTSMGIRRKDPEDERQKKNHEDKNQDEEQGEDRTILSVSALHGFLNNLLQQAGQPPYHPAPAPASPANPVTPGMGGQQAPYRAAASAYQSTAQSGIPPAVTLNDPPATANGPALDLSSAELDGIRRLLKDVEKLAARGIATITLIPASTFLQSLSLGVNEALGD